MTHARNYHASRKEALAPDVAALDERSSRAWTERMSVRQLPDDRYVVEGESGATYVVDLPRGRCTCPDHEIRGERCKHVRRVAIEITLGRVPPPGTVIVPCDGCGETFERDRDATPPHLCPDCDLEPGTLVTDRETGDVVRVVAVTDRRARDVEIPEQGTTVADYPTNRSYDPDDPVVQVRYPGSGPSARDRTYSFPLSRLQDRDESDVHWQLHFDRASEA